MNYSLMIIKIRAALNVSQEELAKMIGVSFTTINRWENNRVTPSKKHICMLENICSLNNIDLFEKRGIQI